MKKQLFGLMSAAALAFTSAPLTVFAEGESTDFSSTGKSPDGSYDYEVWNEGNQGEITFDGDAAEGGAFSCTWNDVRSCQFSKGHAIEEEQSYDELGNVACSYELEFASDGISQFGVTGYILRNHTIIEYSIIEGYNEWTPPGDNYKSVGQVKDHGFTYDIYCINRTQFDAPQYLYSYVSVISEEDNQAGTGAAATISHEVDIDRHFRAWEAAGLDMSGSVTGISFYVYSRECSGSANVIMNEISVNDPTKAAPDYQVRGISDDSHYTYEVWNSESIGQASIKGGKDNAGTFSCEWTDTDNTIFSKGFVYTGTRPYTSYPDLSCEYSMDYYATGSSWYGIHGWFQNLQDPECSVAEYYIIDGYTNWMPPADAASLGTISVNDCNYNVFCIYNECAPTILGMQPCYQYWSVRADGQLHDLPAEPHNTISICEHFRNWDEAGLNMTGNLYEASFYIEGKNSSGQANVLQNEISMRYGTDEETFPAGSTYDCTCWTADDSGETEFDGEDTEGGAFSCKWDDVKGCSFGKGLILNQEAPETYKDLGDINCRYTINYTAEGESSWYGIHGTINNVASFAYPTVEYMIIEGYHGWQPGLNSEPLRTYTVNGCTYELYKSEPALTIEGFDAGAYVAVISEEDNPVAGGSASASRSMSITEHFSEWEKAGLDLDAQIRNIEFYVYGWEGSGEATVFENEITIEDEQPALPGGPWQIRDNTEDGYAFELWNEGGIGTATMDGAAENGGVFSCKWDKTKETIFSKGRHYDGTHAVSYYGGLSCDYAIDYTADGRATQFGVHGWITDLKGECSLAEYFIVDGYTNWTPMQLNGTDLGMYSVGGRLYHGYRIFKEEKETILGQRACWQYWSVLVDGMIEAGVPASVSNTIPIADHFKAWKTVGLDTDGNLAEATFDIYGYESSGEATVKRNYINVWCGPEPDVDTTESADPGTEVTCRSNKGDVDCSGRVDVGDAVLLARFLAEDTEIVLTDSGKANADANGDGTRTTDDVTVILKAIARLITL